MNVFKEMKQNSFPIGTTRLKVMCKVFKDNSGALEIATNHKYRPRTKHISVKLHHFRDYVAQGEIKISKIDMLNQLANILTKPVGESILVSIRKKILGW